MSASPEDELRARCGKPIEARSLTREQVERARVEERLVQLVFTSTFGDSEAGYAFATRWGVTSDGWLAGYVVYPKPIPKELRAAVWGWEEGHEVLAALDAGPPGPANPPAPSPLPPELLADIVAHPDDDAPRLVAADVLSSQGDARGELIVAQCRLATPGKHPPGLAARANALADQALPRWVAELGAGDAACTLRRGFVEALAVGEQPAALTQAWTRAPITELTLGREMMDAFASLEDVSRLRALSLEFSEPTVEHLARVPDTLTRLSCLGPTSESVQALLPRFPALERLQLWHLSVSKKALRALAAAPCERLVEISLSASRLDDAGAAALAAGKFPALERLHLGWNAFPYSRLTDKGRAALAERFGNRLVQ